MSKKTTVSLLIILLVIIGLVILVPNLLHGWLQKQTETTLLNVDLRIAEQELLLVTIADLARRNEADDITNRIVIDCSADERIKFDQLLDSLSVNISPTELKQLDILFYKCGSFYADRKAVMSAKLRREVEVYNDYIDLRNNLVGSSDETLTNRSGLWLKLADSELVFADNFSQLVKLQGDIITALLDDNNRNSKSIMTTLAQVKSTRDQMTILAKQIENYRNAMQSL